MPVATVSIEETSRYDLSSLEGAFIVLKRLPYGDWLTRQEMAIEVTLQAQNGKNPQNDMGRIAFANRKVTEWEFKNCIVEHNLTNADDTPLDFNSSMTFKMLNPRVG